jgi:hypothetical protein
MDVRARKSIASVLLFALIAPGGWPVGGLVAAVPGAASHIPDGRRPPHAAAITVATAFEANLGQFDRDVRFVARGRGFAAFFTDQGATIVVREPRRTGQPPGKRLTSVVSLSLEGAQPRVPTGLDRLPGIVNYFIGRDESAWRTNVPTFGRVQYVEVRPGVDLVYYGAGGGLEYDLVVAPGVDPSSLTLRVDGVEAMTPGEDGGIEIVTMAGALTMKAPVSYQVVGGERRRVESRYLLAHGGAIAFDVGRYDRSRPLVIDPQLVYSSYAGGSGNGVDQINGVAVDSAGAPYLVGTSETTDYPPKSPLQSSRKGPVDAVVTKLTPDGLQLVYSTYLGGGSYDDGTKIAVTGGGAAYVLGDTSSADFPVKSAFQAKFGGASDAFVVALNASGSAITQATFLGGSGLEVAGGIELGRGALNGLLFVHGSTQLANFPKKSASQASRAGARDGFVTAFVRSSLQPSFSTYVGQGSGDFAEGLVANAGRGDLYVSLRPQDGSTFHVAQLAPTGASPVRTWQLGQIKNLSNAAALSLSRRHGTIVIDTYHLVGFVFALAYGSLDGPPLPLEATSAFAVLAAGCVPTGGRSSCNDRAFYTAYDQDLNPIASVNFGGAAAGRQFIPSKGVQHGVDEFHIIGQTTDSTLPLASPVQATNNGSAEGFVMTLNPATGAHSFLSYLGGSSFDFLHDMAIDAAGNRWIVGETHSTDFPTTRSAAQPSLKGRLDGFVVKITP